MVNKEGNDDDEKIFIVLLVFYWIGIVQAQNPVVAPVIQQTGKISNQTLILLLHGSRESMVINHSVLKNLIFFARGDSSHNHRYSLLSQDSRVLFSSYFPDPLDYWVDGFSDTTSPKGGRKILTEADFILKVPYFRNATKIRFEHIHNEGKVILFDAIPLPTPTK